MKTALITGASSGLGVEFLRAAIKQLPQVESFWLIARRRDRLEALKRQFPEKDIRPVPLDLTDPAALQALQELLQAEKPDIALLVNNAGFGKLGDFDASNRDAQTQMVDLNCRALTAVTHICLPYMAQKSLILNVSSIASFAPTPRMAVYCSTKAYVQSFSRALRVELSARKINVLAVCPGPMETEFFPVAGVDNGKSRTFALLPHQDPAKMARTALSCGMRGKSVCTVGAFYKFYRFLSHILPKSFLMKFTKC